MIENIETHERHNETENHNSDEYWVANESGLVTNYNTEDHEKDRHYNYPKQDGQQILIFITNLDSKFVRVQSIQAWCTDIEKAQVWETTAKNDGEAEDYVVYALSIVPFVCLRIPKNNRDLVFSQFCWHIEGVE